MKVISILLVLLPTLWAKSLLYAQVSDTMPPNDNTEIKMKFRPVPKKALLYSFLLPGAGQVYNRRAWKVPIVYAGLGACAFLARDNHRTYKKLDEEYNARLIGESIYQEYAHLNDASVERNRDLFDRNYQLSLFIGVGLYLLQAVEAYTDAHLQNFNVSDDLSFLIGRSTSMPEVPYLSSSSLFNIGITYSLD